MKNKELKSEKGSAAVIVLTAILALLIGIGIGFGIKYIIDKNNEEDDTKNTVIENKNSDNDIENNTTSNTTTNNSINMKGYQFPLPAKYKIIKSENSGNDIHYNLMRNSDQLYSISYMGTTDFETLKASESNMKAQMETWDNMTDVGVFKESEYKNCKYVYIDVKDSGYPAIWAIIEFDTNQLMAVEVIKKSGTATSYDVNTFIDEVVKNQTKSQSSNITTEDNQFNVNNFNKEIRYKDISFE